MNWFPGHMAKAMRSLQERVARTDVVIEVRDARIPFSSHNATLDPLLNSKPRIVVLNKADLADPALEPLVVSRLAQGGCEAMFLTARDKPSVRRLVTRVQGLCAGKSKFKTAGQVLMVVGIPNAGKSTIINAFRQMALKPQALGLAAGLSPTGMPRGVKTGPQPGVTRHVSSILVSRDPHIYLIDSPGIMLPRIDNPEVGLRLAITGAVKDSRMDETCMVDYLLYWWNRRGMEQYVQALQLAGPCDSVDQVLDQVAERLHARRKEGVLDRHHAARFIIQRFREGKLGRFTLDAPEKPAPRPGVPAVPGPQAVAA